MNNNCGICSWIEELKAGSPYLVKELETGFVAISKFQYYKGYTLFLCKQHVNELHELDNEFKVKFLTELGEVGKALFEAVHPDKLNYELLGNAEPHLHWHIFPRYRSDPLFHRPVWVVDKNIRQAETTTPTPQELKELKQAILQNLK